MLGFESFLCHEACHPVLRAGEPAIMEFGCHPGTPVSSAVTLTMDCFHFFDEFTVLVVTLAHLPPTPLVIAAA